ncbi:MAG: exo-alpha-sialidase [Caulobacterales bacterium]
MANPPAASRRRQAFRALLALAIAALSPRAFGADFLRVGLPTPPVAENHGAAIAEMRSGALLVCWYSGLHEENRDVRIVCSRGSNDGSTWSAPWTAVAPAEQAIGAEAPNKSLGNVTLTVTPDGRVWMVYGVIQSRRWPIIGEVCKNWVCGRIDARVSADEGRTWAPAHRLADIGGALPRAELQPVAGGYLGPFYEENQQRAFIARLTLTGTAARLGPIWRLAGYKLIQPALVAKVDGRFRVYLRDQKRQGVYTAIFNPASGRWSDLTRTNLPNPGSAVDAFGDDKGRYVLIYNPSARGRDHLALARSIRGAYFTPGCDLTAPGPKTMAAYPSVIRGRDGAWRVVYSANGKSAIVFARFTSGWLEKCFAPKG